jgi:ethylbenzene dioxygenase beta subunit
MLDEHREREWLETMVSEEIVYQVPLRQTVGLSDGRGFAPGSFHIDGGYGALESRVRRNESGWAWTEDPAPRTRRFVGNVRVSRPDRMHLSVRSNLLVYRTRADQTDPHLLSGERQDVLRREEGGLRLYRRTVLLDASVLGVPNLSYFL